MENLLEDIYSPNDVPYWGENIPVLVVRQLIEEAEKQTLNKVMDKLCDVIDGFAKLGMDDEAMAVNRAYALIKGENK
jgi:hypothetical protein